jgi:hypothetical protein
MILQKDGGREERASGDRKNWIPAFDGMIRQKDGGRVDRAGGGGYNIPQAGGLSY